MDSISNAACVPVVFFHPYRLVRADHAGFSLFRQKKRGGGELGIMELVEKRHDRQR
ncbi:MAG: hypothetical protein WCJ40_15180 [Planctomycetota bacterium]